MTKKHTIFKKSYLPLWSEELVIVAVIQYTHPITYELKDLDGDAITETFYEQEMRKSNRDIFRIEEVFETKGDKIIEKFCLRNVNIRSTGCA